MIKDIDISGIEVIVTEKTTNKSIIINNNTIKACFDKGDIVLDIPITGISDRKDVSVSVDGKITFHKCD